MRKQITTIIFTIFLTFVITQNAALSTVSVTPVPSGYSVEIFGATVTVK